MKHVLWCCLLGLSISSGLRAADVVAPDEKKISELVKALGSDNFQEREEASKSLKAIGQPAKTALEQEMAASKDAEVRASALLDDLKPYLTMALLNAAERAAVKLPIEDLEEGAERAKFITYSNDDYGIMDIGNIRLLSKSNAGMGGRSSTSIVINAANESGSSSHTATINGRKTSTTSRNGVTTVTTPETTFTVSKGVLTISGQKVKFEKRPKVIFIGDKGKFEKLYDFNKDENAPKSDTDSTDARK
jgi:hypothetical protein